MGFIIINIIYYKLFITNKWACDVLNWNHSYIWNAKSEAILHTLATCNKNSSPITCEQNMIGEMEKEKSTRASKGSSNIQPHIYSLKYILWKWDYLNNCTFLSHQWQYLFFINYKEFLAPQNCSSHSHVQRECALFWGQKQVFLPFKINNVYITINKCQKN